LPFFTSHHLPTDNPFVFFDTTGDLTGIISERDYISKIALLGRTSKETKVKEIATQSSKLVTVKPEDPVQMCMEKMLNSDIRHLPLVNDAGELKGMISIKDLVKTTIKEKEQTIKVLSDFALGKGGVYGSE
jgi:CBS domain-containing protein